MTLEAELRKLRQEREVEEKTRQKAHHRNGRVLPASGSQQTLDLSLCAAQSSPSPPERSLPDTPIEPSPTEPHHTPSASPPCPLRRPIDPSSQRRSASPSPAFLSVESVPFKRFLKRLLSVYEPYTLFIEALSRWTGREAEAVLHYCKAYSLTYAHIMEMAKERSASPVRGARRGGRSVSPAPREEAEGEETTPARKRPVLVRHTNMSSLERSPGNAPGVYHSTSPTRKDGSPAVSPIPADKNGGHSQTRMKRWPQTGKK